MVTSGILFTKDLSEVRVGLVSPLERGGQGWYKATPCARRQTLTLRVGGGPREGAAEMMMKWKQWEEEKSSSWEEKVYRVGVTLAN